MQIPPIFDEVFNSGILLKGIPDTVAYVTIVTQSQAFLVLKREFTAESQLFFLKKSYFNNHVVAGVK